MFPNVGYGLRASSFGRTVTVPVTQLSGFFFSPLMQYFNYFLEKALEVGHAGWENQRFLCPCWVGKLWVLLRYPGQGSLLLVGASHPSVDGGMCEWGSGGEAELSCTGVPHWVSV